MVLVETNPLLKLCGEDCGFSYYCVGSAIQLKFEL